MNAEHEPAGPATPGWYRNAKTGDRGEVTVDENGVAWVRLDRPKETIGNPRKPFKADEWVPDVQTHPLTKAQVAMVAHAADRELCRALGKIELSRIEWEDLTIEQRSKLITQQKLKGSERAGLQRVIWDYLASITR
jgi:hypothetical protein